MKRVKTVFINLLSLTTVSLILRSIGLAFHAYLSKKVGPAGIGLLQLVMSIYFLAATFAISGIRLAATRLVAEELGLGRAAGVKRAVKTCLGYSLLFSTATGLVLFFGAGFIGRVWLGETRTILSLRILAVSLPFLAACAVLGGYFTALRQVPKLAAGMLAEQLFRIGATVICFGVLLPRGLEFACAGIALGNCIGEAVNCCLLFLLYRLGTRRTGQPGKGGDMTRRMLRIALPVAFSAYVTSTIRTVQQTLIPRGLRRSGVSSDRALAAYGAIQGMAIPLLMFPSVLLIALADLIVPELAECKAQGSFVRQNYIINRVIHLGLLFSLGCMSILWRFSGTLGAALYNSAEAGLYLKILAPFAPVLYMDLLVDSMLKGIGLQVASMGYNIAESLLGVTLISLLLPKFAIAGYIFTLLLTRGLNFSLSLRRLSRAAPLKVTVGSVMKMIFCLINALIVSNLIMLGLKITWLPLCLLLVTLIYYLMLRLLSCISVEDLTWFKSCLK